MIQMSHVSKKYNKTVIKDATFQIGEQKSVGIVGVNGSGKSTLLSIMAGVLKADQGELFYYQENAFQDKGVFSKYVGYVPQENPLVRELSVMDNLGLWYYRKDQREYMEEMLEEFGLAQERKKAVGDLSGGMQKRLSIICAMANRPKVLLLDEPSAALDIVAKEELKDCLGTYVKAGNTIVMTSHDEVEFSMFDQMFAIVGEEVREIQAHLSALEIADIICQRTGREQVGYV